MKSAVIKKIKQRPELIATFAFMGCAILQKGITFITTPIFTRIMTTEEYGQFSVFSSWSQIIFIIATLSLSSGVYMTGLINNENDKDRFTSSIFTLSTLCIILFFFAFLVIRKTIGNIFNFEYKLFYVIFIDTIFVNAFQFWSRRERVENRYIKLVILTLATSIMTPILGIVFIKLKVFNGGMLDRVMSVIIVDFFAYIGLTVTLIKKGRTLYISKYWKYALKFNLPLIPHYLSQIVLNQSDRIMINSMVGADKAGIYSLAYSLAMIMLIINESINKTLDPWILKKIKNKEYVAIQNISYGLFAVVGLFNLLLIIMAPEIIALFAPVEYFEARWVIPPVAASVFFMFMYNFFADFEFYYSETQYVTLASLIGAVVNIVLNYILIPRFGFIAAGYTTLFCYVIYVFAHYFFMRTVQKKYGISRVYSLRNILLVCLGFLVCVSITTLTYNTTYVRYILVGLILLLMVIFRNVIKEKLIKFRELKNE